MARWSSPGVPPEPIEQILERVAGPGVGEKAVVAGLPGGRQEGDAARLQPRLQLRGEGDLPIREQLLHLQVARLRGGRVGADEERRLLARDPIGEGVNLAVERIEQ